MSAPTDKLPPLAEQIASLLSFAEQMRDHGAASAFKVLLSEAAPYDAHMKAQEARIAELEAERNSMHNASAALIRERDALKTTLKHLEAELRERREEWAKRIDAMEAENKQLRTERDRFATDRAESCKALGERAHPGMSPAENVAAIVGQNAKLRDLAREAATTLPDLEDDEFRAECMARLGKASKALIEDAAGLIQRLAAHHKEK